MFRHKNSLSRARSNSRAARPCIARLRVFSRLIRPLTSPLPADLILAGCRILMQPIADPGCDGSTQQIGDHRSRYIAVSAARCRGIDAYRSSSPRRWAAHNRSQGVDRCTAARCLAIRGLSGCQARDFFNTEAGRGPLRATESLLAPRAKQRLNCRALRSHGRLCVPNGNRLPGHGWRADSWDACHGPAKLTFDISPAGRSALEQYADVLAAREASGPP